MTVDSGLKHQQSFLLIFFRCGIRRGWAKTLFFFFILSVLVFIFYFFVVRAKMRMQVQIEHIERNKIEEISQEKVRFYINMSHELRTPLSLILAPLEELLGEKNSFEPWHTTKTILCL